MFHRIKVRTDRKACCLSNTGPMMWNRLPKKIKNIYKMNYIKKIDNIVLLILIYILDFLF